MPNGNEPTANTPPSQPAEKQQPTRTGAEEQAGTVTGKADTGAGQTASGTGAQTARPTAGPATAAGGPAAAAGQVGAAAGRTGAAAGQAGAVAGGGSTIAGQSVTGTGAQPTAGAAAAAGGQVGAAAGGQAGAGKTGPSAGQTVTAADRGATTIPSGVTPTGAPPSGTGTAGSPAAGAPANQATGWQGVLAPSGAGWVRGVKPIDPFHFDQADHDARGPQSGTVALYKYLVDHFGAAKHEIYNPRSTEAGEVSRHSEGRAIDYYLSAKNDSERARGDNIMKSLTANKAELARRLGVQQILWNHQAWDARHPEKGVHPITGKVAPHDDHMHIEQNRAGAQKGTSYWSP